MKYLAVHFNSYTEARTRFKELLDAAERGRVATVRRDAVTSAVVDGERLRHLLAKLSPAKAQVVSEDGGWSVFLPGLPLAAEGETLEDALTDMVGTLREYAEDWQEHLLESPNHKENWGLVQMISLSTDEQLRAWLVGEAR